MDHDAWLAVIAPPRMISAAPRMETSVPLTSRLLNRLLGCLCSGSLLMFSGSAFAAIDIVNSAPEGSGSSFVVKNTSTGKVLGTFWEANGGASDYGFESSIVPDFFWSQDRAYVAVSGGASRSRGVSLYKVVGNALKEIERPFLNAEQAAPIDAIKDIAAEGTDVEHWNKDGTLVLRFWASEHVASDTATPKEVNVWADLEIQGAKAVIVGTSSEKPMQAPAGAFPNPAPPAGETLATQGMKKSKEQPAAEDKGYGAENLVGVHQVVGYNPDGTTYKGQVEIKLANGMVGLEWKIGKTVSHGIGVLVGQTLGVALDDGIALYKVVGQSEGQSLIGVWSGAGSSQVNKDSILIGNADMTQANFDQEPLNGKYMTLREVKDGQIETFVTVTGEGQGKKVVWDENGKKSKVQGIAIADAFAVLTPSGVAVYEKHVENDGNVSLVGATVSHEGHVSEAHLDKTE